MILLHSELENKNFLLPAASNICLFSSIIAEILYFKTVEKLETILTPVPKWLVGNRQGDDLREPIKSSRKLLSTDFVNSNSFIHYYMIVSRGDWLWKPANIIVESNGAVGYVGSSLIVHNPLFFVTELINSMLLVVSKFKLIEMQLSVVHGQVQKSKQKHITRRSKGFHNHSKLLIVWFSQLLFCILKS